MIIPQLSVLRPCQPDAILVFLAPSGDVMFSWLFGKKESRVKNLIHLMEARPLEWEFGRREKNSYSQLLSHANSDLVLRIGFPYSHSEAPDSIKIAGQNNSPFKGDEKLELLAAIDTLRHSRYDSIAKKYLKLQVKVNCAVCAKKIIGWSWICKCQALLDQTCYKNSNVCPECGGSLVGDFHIND